MPDRTVGPSDAKVNPTGQFPALPEPYAVAVAGDPLQRKERRDTMQRNGAEGGATLDLVVLQYSLNQEDLELRQDGKEKPSSGAERTVRVRAESRMTPKGGQRG